MAIQWLSVVSVVILVAGVSCGDNNSDLEKQMRVLSKQVTTLLDRRREDLQSIEENLRRKLYESSQLVKVQNDIQLLRQEVEQLRHSNIHTPITSSNHQKVQSEEEQQANGSSLEKNDRLTVKWLSNTVAELKTELIEVQTTLNSTVILQNHEQVDTELSLLRSDVSNLNKELEIARKRNVKFEAELLEAREELASLKDNGRVTAAVCGKTKNQLKAVQLEWNHNWKLLNEKRPFMDLPDDDDDNNQTHPSRHQRILKKHILSLEKTSKTLRRESDHVKTKLLKVEEEMRLLQRYVTKNKDAADTNEVVYDRINGNEIQDYVRMEKIREIKSDKYYDQLYNLTEQQIHNTAKIANLTKQLSNFDKLHMSMLELLENVESIENKVDNSFPEFRKEISKLELQVTESNSQISMLKEDQTNTRNSMKAIGVSVSNMQDKTDADREHLQQIDDVVTKLMKSTTMQTSKLHDHILKAESSTLDLNSTKSTIHLVQELKSFEKEYKSIINKLPHDCSAVDGPSGIYLISPGDGEPILAHCENGWTTIQKRYDGSVNFNRNWNEYSNGFGSATGEHWMGNRNLHYLTKENCTRLRINMKDIYGKYWQATYDDFRVADYTMGFKLSVDKYTGNASDALDYQNHMEFSTVDNDRDISNTHCASNYEGGWWFSHCQHANLNGRYNLGLTWFDSSRNEWIAVSNSEMRVKRRDHC